MDFSTPEWQHRLAEGAAGLQVELDARQTLLFARYAAELIHWNRRMNLTAITDPQEILSRHFLDSLVPLPILPPAARVLDMGSGGGFPGVPLKIAKAQMKILLVEASRKKVSFQKHLIRSLGLAGIDSQQRRLEPAPQRPIIPEGFDVVVSRAVADLPLLAAWACPQMAPQSLLVAWRGRPDPRQEEAAADVLARAGRACRREQLPYRLPGVPGERHLALLHTRLEGL